MRELHESAKQILIKQRNKDILREAFLYDVRRLEEARALSQTLLSEGVIEQKIEDQYLLDEGIFDTIKALGKNVGGAALNKAKEVGGAALNKAKAEWDKAKEQGNQAELARLQARMAQLQGKAAPAAPAPAASAAATKRKPVLPTKAAPAPAPTKTPPVLPTKAAPAPAPTKTPPVLPTKAAPAPAIPNKKVPMAPAAPSGEDKAILNKAAEEIVVQMAQNDPQKFQTLIGKSPAELQKMLASPQVEKEQDKAEGELATDPAAQKKPGFLGKLWTKTKAIAKKHPILFWGGLGLFAATVGAAAVGAGGAGALLASIVAKVAASKATIATAGLMKGTMAAGKEFITQKRAGGKMDYKKILKVGGKEAAKGAAYTTAAVAGGSLLGHAATGVSKIASGIGNSMSGLFGAKGAADMKASTDAPASAANATSAGEADERLAYAKKHNPAYMPIDSEHSRDRLLAHIKKLGLDPSKATAQLHGHVPVTINGKDITSSLSPEEAQSAFNGMDMSKAMGNKVNDNIYHKLQGLIKKYQENGLLKAPPAPTPAQLAQQAQWDEWDGAETLAPDEWDGY
jgi:hypothetical protein